MKDMDPYGSTQTVRRDFISQLSQDLKYIFKGVSPVWTDACARTTLSTILANVRIAYAGRPLKLNQFNICIGPPGAIKSLPLDFCREIIERVDQKTKYAFILPSKFTSPAMIEHLSEVRKGTEKRWPRQYKHNHGTIFRDEFTALFKQARQVDYMTDMLEFLSELYDGTVQKKRTKEHGLEQAPDVFVNMITATTYDFLSKVDDDFFIQGTGTRFLYSVLDFKDIKVESFERKHFLDTVLEDREEMLELYANWLVDLYKVKSLTNLFLEHSAFKRWNVFNTKTRNTWLKLGQKDPMGWEYPYLVRLPEYTLKLAGLYAISNGIDRLIRAHDKKKLDYIKKFSISEQDMIRAENKIRQHNANFKKLVHLRKTLVGKWKPKSHTQYVYTIIDVLKNMPNSMANYSQWFAIQTVCSSETTFQKYKLTAIATGKVKEIDKSTIKEPTEIKRLRADKPATKIYKAI